MEVPPGYELIACPLCGGRRSDVVLRGGDRVLHEVVNLTVVRCADCKLCYLNPRPTFERLGDYYPKDYHAHRTQRGDVIGNNTSVRIRKLLLRHLYARPEHKPTGAARSVASAMVALQGSEWLGPGHPVHGEGKLLDFGCGNGKLLRR